MACDINVSMSPVPFNASNCINSELQEWFFIRLMGGSGYTSSFLTFRSLYSPTIMTTLRNSWGRVFLSA